MLKPDNYKLMKMVQRDVSSKKNSTTGRTVSSQLVTLVNSVPLVNSYPIWSTRTLVNSYPWSTSYPNSYPYLFFQKLCTIVIFISIFCIQTCRFISGFHEADVGVYYARDSRLVDIFVANVAHLLCDDHCLLI